MNIFKNSVLIFLVFSLFSCANIQHYKQQSNNTELERWKKAVIQLEGAADSLSFDEQRQLSSELVKQFREGNISKEEYIQGLMKGRKDIRSQGTAIFLEHEGRYYLITARHVDRVNSLV